MVAPAAERLLQVTTGEQVLDVACGNGQFSRRLAALGAQVVTFDQAPSFIERARRYPSDGIDYQVIDATDGEALLTLGPRPFHAAVANMALMDMPAVVPLFLALATLLEPGARFVFTIIHPCFGYGPRPTGGERPPPAFDAAVPLFTAVVPDRVRLPVMRRLEALDAGLASLRYLEPRERHAIGIVGQPVPHRYFHRPLADLLAPAFEAGFVLDGVLEPPFPGAAVGRPALLAARLRLLH